MIAVKEEKACIEEFLSNFPSFAPSKKSGWPWQGGSRLLPKQLNGADWPKISIVTPSLNQSTYLESTIRSVLLQNYPALEYIVIDGGSSDESLEIIQKYEPWLSYWTSAPDKGQYWAINKGFAKSNGRIMGWLNSDDMLLPGALWVIASIFAQFSGEVRWITGHPAVWDRYDRLVGIGNTQRYLKCLLQCGCYEGRGLGWIQQESTFWRRSLWEEAGGALSTNWPLAADYELWLRFSRHSPLYSVHHTIGGFRQHSDQKTVSKEKYYKEIDSILSHMPTSRRKIARIFRIKRVKHLMHMVMHRIIRKKTIVYYSPFAEKWMLSY
jgi:glycosyltransferase involved in cell wall biosynthesis